MSEILEAPGPVFALEVASAGSTSPGRINKRVTVNPQREAIHG
jgi:hypothetical protein